MRILKNKVARALQRQQGLNLNDIKVEDIKLESSELSLNSETFSVKHEESDVIEKKTRQNRALPKPKSKSKSKSEAEPKQTQCRSPSKNEKQSNKNIVKNYARAMINFALSGLAIPYLNRITVDIPVNVKDFRAHLQEQKEDVNSIKKLRDLLLIYPKDSKEMKTYKKVFKEVCEIFVKCFSVNWIFNSKVSDKLTHLKYRFKVLRRIRRPECFTYIENFNKTR